MNELGKWGLTGIKAITTFALIITYIGICIRFKTNSIKSKRRIEPEIILTINDKKIDTLYIYKKP